MIVVEVIDWNKLHVIHYSKNIIAIITEEVRIINPSDVYRIDYDPSKSHSGQEAIDRARTRCGESSYDLVSNNCESFCTWVKVNQNSSSQVQVGVDVAAGVVVVAALSFVLYRVLQSSNNKSK